LNPIEYYQKLIENGEILKDDQQSSVVNYLQSLFDQLMGSNTTLLGKFFRNRGQSPQGLYLWGDVGIGKTFVIDCFFNCLPFSNKLRVHFHQFMNMTHQELKSLQGKTNPLKRIARKLAGSARLICLDELIVNDIADAMLLEGFLKALYKEGICLLFTSNSSPDRLYWKGLQRDSFLPAIELIKNRSKIIHLNSNRDYRLINYDNNLFYYMPLNNETDRQLQQEFKRLTQNFPNSQESLRIYDRTIPIRNQAKDVIWFNFLDICGIPRSKDDFLVIANHFNTIMISNITPIQPEQNDLARSFINLIDVLYDSRKKIIFSAEKPIDDLYRSGRMSLEFTRTRSRLIEMQTLAWQKKCD
jgi:cell division protein ZapE